MFMFFPLSDISVYNQSYNLNITITILEIIHVLSFV
jgi:hypothetical protein